MLCKICGLDSKRLFKKHDYWIRSCVGCGRRFCEVTVSDTHVDVVYNDDYFTGGNAGYSNYLEKSSILIEHGRRYGRLMQSYMEAGKVLDIGAAAGFILKGLMDTGWSGAGIEPNKSMASYARQVLRLEVHIGSLERFQAQEQYELLTFIQVLPHLFNLQAALSRAKQLTGAGGYWMFETWDRESLTAKVLGRHWHEYSPPSVLHWFSIENVVDLGRRFGFQYIAHGRPKKVIDSGHARSLLSYKLPFFMQWLPRLVPEGKIFSYPAEDLFWILLQRKD